MTKGWVSFGIMVVAVIARPSHAATFSPPTAEAVLKRACSGKQGQSISTQRLAEALVIEAGLFPSDLAQDGERLTDVIWRLSDPETQVQGDLERQMAGAVQSLEAKFRKPVEGSTAQVENAPTRFKWLFNPITSWTVQCGGEVEAQTSYVANFEKSNPHPLLVLRGSVDDLSDQGKYRLKSSSLKLGVTRTRSILEDGSRKTDTSLSVNGTLGLRLTPADSVSDVIHAFASYSLLRERSRPAAPLAVGVDENDGDTNSLEVGLAGNFQITSNESVFKLFASMKASILNDFVHDSRIGRLGIGIEPAFNADLIFCKLGSFKPLIDGAAGLYARCGGQLEIEGAHVFKVGTSEFGLSDEYLATGFNASYELFSPTFGDDGIFAKARYRYLPVIHGNLPDIKRFDAEVAYRIWSAGQIGFDLGLTYARGTNPKSFEKENSLVLGFGVLF